MKIWLDMDGVLADFDSHYLRWFGIKPTRWPDPDNVDWAKVARVKDFFRTIPEMPDARDLLTYVILRKWPWGVLTGVPKSVDAANNQKIEWIHARVNPPPEVVCCPARDKYKHGQPGDVLVDDYLKYKDRWVAMGGIFVHHTSAETSVARLRELL